MGGVATAAAALPVLSLLGTAPTATFQRVTGAVLVDVLRVAGASDVVAVDDVLRIAAPVAAVYELNTLIGAPVMELTAAEDAESCSP
jgi:hypothetical protein